MVTVADMFNEYADACGKETPARSLDELRDEFHRRGYQNYAQDGLVFLDEVFDDGWAFGEEDLAAPYVYGDK